jgi:predicted DNA-binding protein (MmcQ/YjbR family)
MTLSPKQLTQSTRRRERLIKACRTLPEVTFEFAGDGHITFRVRKKIFAYYLYDHHGDGISLSVASRASASSVDWSETMRKVSSCLYLGREVGSEIRLDLDDVDWETVNELARQAFQAIAPRKLAVLVE